jgi:hydroxymethylbilane synthase
MVATALKNKYPDLEIQVVHITTTGDKILNKPLDKIGGKGVFVTEIERALIDGEIDIAVHSAKDLPMELGNNLEIISVLPRGNYRDVLVTNKNVKIKNTESFIVGTGSVRRRLSLSKLYDKVKFADIRGNVDTRLKKLKSGQYNAVVLAMAGLERLKAIDESEFNFLPFDYNEFLPAPCQGIIAVEGSKGNFAFDILKGINDENTFISFETEREVLRLLNGDCQTPVGAYSFVKGNTISLTVTRDWKNIVQGRDEIFNRLQLAKRLVDKL